MFLSASVWLISGRHVIIQDLDKLGDYAVALEGLEQTSVNEDRRLRLFRRALVGLRGDDPVHKIPDGNDAHHFFIFYHRQVTHSVGAHDPHALVHSLPAESHTSRDWS